MWLGADVIEVGRDEAGMGTTRWWRLLDIN